MKALTKILNGTSKYVAWVSMLGLTIMMFMITFGVLTRLIFNKPVTGSYEIVQVIMSVVVFGSFAYTQSKHGHVHVTMLIAHLPNTLRFVFFSITSLLSTGVMAFTAFAAFRQGAKYAATGMTTGILYLPQAPFYYIEAITLVLFTAVLLLDAVKAILAIVSKPYAEEVMSFWT